MSMYQCCVIPRYTTLLIIGSKHNGPCTNWHHSLLHLKNVRKFRILVLFKTNKMLPVLLYHHMKVYGGTEVYSTHYPRHLTWMRGHLQSKAGSPTLCCTLDRRKLNRKYWVGLWRYVIHTKFHGCTVIDK